MKNSEDTEPENINRGELNIYEIHNPYDFPSWLDLETLIIFLHKNLKPYEDSIEDIGKAFEYLFSDESGKGGFILIAEINKNLLGALVMLNTGMSGYVPENILLFVAVDAKARGMGIGGKIIKHAFKISPGDVKLHVEYDNPAKRLYERLGMTTKYAEMRYHK